ncbi:cell division protein FtsE [Methyloradius palustris]|uniref:Cell division ATP-binding protein FtsE n=2 Tax=Methyloradius palustris TaxID=2778876 RepID=A0A8D5K0A5_9PROT|nr:cell division protein FtsE [Methyloradius palustris]
MEMIRFDQVSKRYPGSHEALKGVSFELQQGEMVFVLGHSGAGKSTLLKLIAGIERPTSGTVLINNQNVSKLRPAALPYLRRKFGLVFQDHKLLYDRNCFENVALPLYINGVTGSEAGKRIRAALDKVGLLGKEKAMPITLSGGEQQRLAIARAVVSRPSVLIADEPTGNLDENYATEIMGIFDAFRQVGVSVIIATHNLHDTGDARVLRLNQGQLLNAEEGTLIS